MKEMEMTLNLKITWKTDTEQPFFIVTPTCKTYYDTITCYPLFVGTMKQVARFVSQCCNTTIEIAIDEPIVRNEMSRTIDEIRSR
ncbi:MAG: hypothetical protein WCX81_01465 [Monoglobales bacterium]